MRQLRTVQSYIVVEAGKKQEAFDDFPTRALARAWAKKARIRNYSIVLVESSVPQTSLPRRKPLASANNSRAAKKHKKNRMKRSVAPPSRAPLPPPSAISRGLVRLFSGEEPPPVRSPARPKPKQSRTRQKQFWCTKCVKRQRNEFCEFHGTRNKPLTPSLKSIVGPARREPYHGSVRNPYQGGLPQ